MNKTLSELLADPKPWFTPDSIAYLEEEIRSDDVVLEFGGGVSSIWWARKAAYTYTYEADAAWAAILLAEMHKRPELLAKWGMCFSGCEWSNTAEQPKTYWTKHRELLNPGNIQRLEDIYCDIPASLKPSIIVIDGSIRPRTADVTAVFIKTNSVRLIVVDNMESMSRYVADKFEGYKQIDFHEDDLALIPKHQNGKWCTSVFLKEE